MRIDRPIPISNIYDTVISRLPNTTYQNSNRFRFVNISAFILMPTSAGLKQGGIDILSDAANPPVTVVNTWSASVNAPVGEIFNGGLSAILSPFHYYRFEIFFDAGVSSGITNVVSEVDL